MSGYTKCACRDCFDIAIGSDPVLCHDCEDSDCDESGETECQRTDIYLDPETCGNCGDFRAHHGPGKHSDRGCENFISED